MYCHGELFHTQVLEVEDPSIQGVIPPATAVTHSVFPRLPGSPLSYSCDPSLISPQDSKVRAINRFPSALPCPLASVFICLAERYLAKIKVMHSA